MIELSALSENIVTVPYKHGDDTLELQVNIDAFTPEFWRAMKARAEEKFKALEKALESEIKTALQVTPKKEKKPHKKLTEAQKIEQAEEQLRAQLKEQLDSIEGRARQLEAERETNIEFLIPHILKGWDATDKGVPVPLTKEVLMPLPPRLIQEIFEVCVKAAKTVKKRVDQDEDGETSESTNSGSQGLRVVGQTG